jgi:GR25 family glycosyltransferase involved in LPS biosynthesis
MDLQSAFDRVVVVNLARRPERMERFWNLLGDWPFQRPRRFEAVDGLASPPPPTWDKGPGAWGCLLSHRAVLERAIGDRVNSILVLEDDAYPVPGFSRLAGEFLERVPNDWDCLMLGAEHLERPISVGPGVVRCVASNRTHAFALRGRFMKVLLEFWTNTANDHCDVVMASLMRHFSVYSPDPLLIGQNAGESDISGRGEPLRFLAGTQKEAIARVDKRHALQALVIRLPASRAPKV